MPPLSSPAPPDSPPRGRQPGDARRSGGGAANPTPTGAEGHRRERRALWWGLALSLVAHLALLAVYPLVMARLTPDEVPQPDDRPRVELSALEVVQLEEVEAPPEDAAEPEEESPQEETVPEPEVATPEVPALPQPAEDAPAPEDEAERERTLAELLTPQPGDPRLWAPLDEDYARLTDEERAQLMLHGMIRSWNDSVAVAAALSEAATDWTHTDDEGRRWGLSPGRLHLGDFSIPLPFQFNGSRELLEDRMRDEWTLQDLTRGAAAAVIRETWAERARAIRERMDAERERRRNDGGN